MYPDGQLRKLSVETANREGLGCIEIKQSVESPQAGHCPVPRAAKAEVLLDEMDVNETYTGFGRAKGKSWLQWTQSLTK